MSNTNNPPLDEIQWYSSELAARMGGLHSNTILFYFAESPFFERTSNNAVIMNQAMNNMSMYHFIQTREVFEARLKTMSGLEFIVGEEPAEMGPGMGTGVWVIRKQTRRKRYHDEDEVTVHASYFVVGENIYMAPTLADILASRVMTISSAISKALPAAESIRDWQPSTGHTYKLPLTKPTAKSKTQESKLQESKEATPMPDAAPKSSPASAQESDEVSLNRLVEESLRIHMRYGGDYIDENPITGRPGEFHLSSTGRKAVPAPTLLKEGGIGSITGPTINTKVDDKKDGKDKSPKSATMPKPKRRKSRMSTSTSAATTPAPS